MKNKLWLCILTKSGLITSISIFVLIFNCYSLRQESYGQGTWTQKMDFGGAARAYATGFSVGTKGYICCGDDGGIFPAGVQNDLWEWDQATNTWTQKAPFTGTARRKAFGFSIGTKGYVGCGQDAAGYTKDFYEYNPSSNTWTKKSDFGGTARYGAVGFSIGTKGYAGTGYEATGPRDDFWEYNPSTNGWVQKAILAGGIATAARLHAFGIGSATKGYIGGGDNGSTAKLDFWEYDPGADSWIKKANFNVADRTEAVAFFIGTKGYAGTGIVASTYYQDLRAYDPSNNTWTAQASLPAPAVKRKSAVGFSIGTKGYIGTGIDNAFTSLNDFWEFNPGVGGVNEYENLVEVCIFPNPFSENAMLSVQSSTLQVSGCELKIYDVFGQEVRNLKLETKKLKLERGNFSSGIYFYSLQSKNKILATGKIIIE